MGGLISNGEFMLFLCKVCNTVYIFELQCWSVSESIWIDDTITHGRIGNSRASKITSLLLLLDFLVFWKD